jgi:hypothetical protein
MNPRRLRLWLAVIIFLIAVTLIAASLLPSPRLEQVFPVPPIVLPAATPVSWVFLLEGI